MAKIDWNEMWRATEDSIERSNNLEFWNDFAPRFGRSRTDPDPYIDMFYEYLETSPEDTLFDMGCGPGTLAIPFAEKGHEIYAADFSPEMLKHLMIRAGDAGVADRIHPIELNWNEDWSVRDLPKCDIAFSSRSFITRDLTSSLEKLESVAKRRVCIAAWDNPTTGYDRHVAKAIGYERPGIGTHYMIMGELMDRDVFPEMKYIYTPFRLDKYPSREAAEEGIRKAFDHMTPEQEGKFRKYLEDHLKYHDEKAVFQGKDMDGYWQLDHNDNSSIAFISWNLKSVYD
ncbi:MAG: class I SAM-dependent methyltransferase [Bacillota bacterium]